MPLNDGTVSHGLQTDSQIERLVEQFGIIKPFDPARLSGCSYDLSVGRPVRSRNRSRLFDLSKGDYAIESGECITFETLEVLDFANPALFGWIVNKHSVLAKGLVHPITKVDPGFVGPLAVTFFNHGNKAETIELAQAIVSLVIMSLPTRPQRIYGATQRPSYREGSLDIASLNNEPAVPLDDKALSRMYGAPVSRLYDRVEELEKRFDIGLIKLRGERRNKRADLLWRIIIPTAAVIIGALINQNWIEIAKFWRSIQSMVSSIAS